MGWAVKLISGEIVRESDNVNWNDINIQQIDRLWIEGFEEYVLSRSVLNNFTEFIQFKTACIGSDEEAVMESRCIGWTDGAKEFLIRFYEKTKKVVPEIGRRIHFHPKSTYVLPETSNV